MTSSDVEVNGFDSNILGNQTIEVVIYADEEYLVEIDISVYEINKIEVTANPTKTSYIQNYNTLNLSGGKIKATYNDTSTETQ
jgi:hypothetical protein